MKLRLSTVSVDTDSIRAIQWNIEEIGITRDTRIEAPAHWLRTYIYFKNITEPLTLSSFDANYESDVEKLEQAWHPPTTDIRVSQ